LSMHRKCHQERQRCFDDYLFHFLNFSFFRQDGTGYVQNQVGFFACHPIVTILVGINNCKLSSYILNTYVFG
jgi:hypothetical protein